MGKRSPEVFNSAGMGWEWFVEFCTRFVQSSDLDVDDLGLSASLENSVWAMSCGTIDELVETIFGLHAKYEGDTLEHVWQGFFRIYNQALRALGNNDFNVE